MEKDKRCPCNICAVQVVCTDYCSKFHLYRELVLAEVNVYISQIIDEYHSSPTNSMSLVWHDLRTAHEKYIENKVCAVFEYSYIVEKLSFLESRFVIIVENSVSAGRGICIIKAEE